MRWDRAPDTGLAIRQAAACGLVLSLVDDAEARALLDRAGALAGLDVMHAPLFDDCLAAIALRKPDLIVTRSAGLPLDAARFAEAVTRIKTTESLPVLFLDEGAAEHGLAATLAAFDVVQSTFLRIRAVLRRDRPSVLTDTRNENGLMLDEPAFRLSFGPDRHDLSKGELCLLGPFFDAPETVFDRVSLERLAFNTAHHVAGNRQIDFYINRLRRSVKQSLGIDPLRSVRGRGYVLARP